MAILLRIIGIFWIFMTAKPVYYSLRRVLATGHPQTLGLKDLLYLLLLAGGIGLLLLKGWGRWIILLGAASLLILSTGNSLIQLKITPFVLRQLIFYGIFIVLLILPQSRGATYK